MILQNLALKKSKEVVSHNAQTWRKTKNRTAFCHENGMRSYATGWNLNSQLREELAKEHVKDLSNQQRAKKEARAVDKDFFMSVLGSSATKRDAKAYLQRFNPSTPPSHPSLTPEQKGHLLKCEVNLGGFYAPASVEESPKFVQHPYIQTITAKEAQLHLALVKIRAPQSLEDETLTGIGRTLSQLSRLGLISVVVIDCDTEAQIASSSAAEILNWKKLLAEQANRVVTAIESTGETGARLVDNVIGFYEKTQYGSLAPTKANVAFRNLLMTPLRRGIIPVIPAIAYTNITQKVVPISGADTILALSTELSGFPAKTLPDEDPQLVKERMTLLQNEVSLEKLIILDPLGGIPTSKRQNGYHVFLNMEEEYESAKQDLLRGVSLSEKRTKIHGTADDVQITPPSSKSIRMDTEAQTVDEEMPSSLETSSISKSRNSHHLQNLELVRAVLSMLPPSSSALLTTPEEAANSGREAAFQPGGVGTRRQRNPLIHNLLTDKPVFSSSLPLTRLGSSKIVPTKDIILPSTCITTTTFAKHGMPITIFPDPNIAPWEPPVPGTPHLTLTDSRIDLPRLVHLIDDSFGRKLDVNDYLKRVNGRIAGVVIAGEYEGGALLTWEVPPGVVDDGSPESRARMVPYLDKFAVLKKAQGSGGVADVVFTAMVRTCFPNGVVWRSRTTNVVNKWYFERSRGTWRLPDTGWTMFWTTPDMDRQTFLDYERVCRGIEPSWADNKTVLD